MPPTPREPTAERARINRNVLVGGFTVIVLFVAAFAGGGVAVLLVGLVAAAFVRGRNKIAREQAEHRHAWGDW